MSIVFLVPLPFSGQKPHSTNFRRVSTIAEKNRQLRFMKLAAPQAKQGTLFLFCIFHLSATPLTVRNLLQNQNLICCWFAATVSLAQIKRLAGKLFVAHFVHSFKVLMTNFLIDDQLSPKVFLLAGQKRANLALQTFEGCNSRCVEPEYQLAWSVRAFVSSVSLC